MNLKLIAATIIFSAATFSASAQVNTTDDAKKANTIQNNKKRIRQGVKSGELTNAEAIRLAAQTKELKEDRADYKADGQVTAAERKEFRKDKKTVSKRIYRQKHDRQTKP